MAIKKPIIAQANLLLNGWGYVEGQWVYVPLWDPPKAFGNLVAAAAIADGAKLISNSVLSKRLHAAAGALLGKASAGFTQAWEDGDPICPELPHIPHWPIPFPWPYPGPGPGPGPLDGFIQKLDPVAQNALVGNMVVLIGRMIGDKAVIEVGTQIMTAG